MSRYFEKHTQPAPIPVDVGGVDPLALYLFFLALQLSAGAITADDAARNLAEMQLELGRRTILLPGSPPGAIEEA